MNQLTTTWGETLDRGHILEEYPRPQMMRTSYCNLNGSWKYAITKSKEIPETYDGTIFVPFSPEAALSGVNRQLLPGEYLWYERVIEIDRAALGAGAHLLLHFGAVDERCRIYLNGILVGTHRGGYTAFTIDLTKHLRQSEKDTALLQVCVKDDSDTSYHARGKQKLHRKGMYYTAQSGIWQTVWMEYVPASYIKSYRVSPGTSSDEIRIEAITSDADDHAEISLAIDPADLYMSEEKMRSLETRRTEDVSEAPFLMQTTIQGNTTTTLTIPDAKLWAPESPYLYTFTLTYGEDTIYGYFALRNISIGEADGHPRILLNQNFIYQRGALDQGYWPDGLYTAPADGALIYDIQTIKSIGYNMLRKHCKVEAERFYYHCDRLGVIVWQDMVNGGEPYKDWYITYAATVMDFLHMHPSDANSYLLSRKNEKGKAEFQRMTEEIVNQLYNHPCICTWVLFNEGWGQFGTQKNTTTLRRLDATRLIDSASGWFDQGCGDFLSIHNYFFKLVAKSDHKRAFVVSEYGGYSMVAEGHVYGDGLYGYGTYKNIDALQAAYEKRNDELFALIDEGLCASVYTQVSDIEDEVNGILTYDRKLQKIT